METRYDFGGDEYIFVDFDIEMSLEVNFKILSICQAIDRERVSGVIEVCPGNSSYLVHYRPEEIEPHKLVKELQKFEHQAEHIAAISSRIVDIPVLYDDPWTKVCAKQFAERHQDSSVTNLEYLMRINGFSDKQEFIEAHSGRPYWISMVGFVPGTAWGYQMVPRARALQAPKYVRPRTDTPERTVSHGGAFLAILPLMMRDDVGRLGRVFAVASGIQGLVHVALVAVLLMAIFGERAPGLRTPSAIPGAPSA